MKIAILCIVFLFATVCARYTEDDISDVENSVEEDILKVLENKEEPADITEVDIDGNNNSPDILTPPPTTENGDEDFNADEDFDTSEDFDADEDFDAGEYIDEEANDAAAVAGLTEVEVNAMNNFEGDEMIISEEDKKRGVGPSTRLWPRVRGRLNIPYRISPSFPSHRRSTLMSYINKMNGHLRTCNSGGAPVWIPRTTQTHYIEFQPSKGCSSYVGYTMKAAQPIKLAPGCFSGTILHEMLHAMGFLHEQSRSDRDQYVTILYNNIQPDRRFNFNKMPSMRSESRSTPYDYGSILHYPKSAFAIVRGKTTIQPKKAGVTIGQRRDMSSTDVLEAKNIYQCSGTKPTPRPTPTPTSTALIACNFNQRCSYTYISPKWTKAGACADSYSTSVCRGWKTAGFCSSINRFYRWMRAKCPVTCGFCSPTAGGYLATNKSKALVSLVVHKSRFAALRQHCRCSSTNGFCTRRNFCVQFRYRLSASVNTRINRLRVNGYSRQAYGSPRKYRGRYSHSVYIPYGSANVWKTMKASIFLECTDYMLFQVITASKQSKMIKMDNLSVKLGSC